MVIVLASSVVGREFEPRSGQTKEYKIGIWCFSAKQAAFRRKDQVNMSECYPCIVDDQVNMSECYPCIVYEVLLCYITVESLTVNHSG